MLSKAKCLLMLLTKYESDEMSLAMSLNDSNGTLYVCAGHNLGGVLPQFHEPSCRRGKGWHPPSLCSRDLQLSWSSIAVTLDLFSVITGRLGCALL